MQAQSDRRLLACAVVVTRQPTADLSGNLNLLKKETAQIVIVDNGSSGTALEGLLDLKKKTEILLIRNPRNLGIGAALNLGIKESIARGFNWVATFDQDSSITPGYFEQMRNAYEACPYREQVALLSPVHCFSKEACEDASKDSRARLFTSIRGAMTSGCLLKAEVFGQAGFYDETMFMDYVDYEFCLRLCKLGFKLIRANRAALLHQLGKREHHSVLGLGFSASVHSPWRRYFIARNRVHVYKLYGRRFPAWTLRDILGFMMEMGKVLFLEQEKRAKLANTWRGICDGVAGRLDSPFARVLRNEQFAL